MTNTKEQNFLKISREKLREKIEMSPDDEIVEAGRPINSAMDVVNAMVDVNSAAVNSQKPKKEKHVLGLSGGRDSAALAVYMRQMHPEIDVEYFFTDTGKELPEVYEFLTRLEGVLGKEINHLNPDKGFEFWLKHMNGFLPSAQSRWCTRQLKLVPFEKWIFPMLDDGYTVHSYVAIRSDEDYREGYSTKKENLNIVLPFRADGVDKAGVINILEASGLGLPDYYQWRSRSGCTFCFYQQKIEWVGLMERHPEAFEEAKAFEKFDDETGKRFTWIQGESLEELSRPERVAQIKSDHKARVERLKSKVRVNPLRPNKSDFDMDDIYGQTKSCLTCHK